MAGGDTVPAGGPTNRKSQRVRKMKTKGQIKSDLHTLRKSMEDYARELDADKYVYLAHRFSDIAKEVSLLEAEITVDD